MPYNHVVIVGGGPVGLLCAIEARRQGFQHVTIIEKRGEYTRHNVPQIGEPLLSHLKKINAGLNDTDKMPIERNALGGASFKEIEPVLLNKARDGGAKLYRPYLINSLRGGSEQQNGRFKEVVLTIQECDAKGKAVVADARPLQITANLLIIATGGGAAEDPIVTNTLGFQYERLKPENYMVLGIFELHNNDDFELEEELENTAEKIIRIGGISFETADYQYFLSDLGGITTADFNLLKKSQVLLARLVVALKRAHTKTSGEIEKIKEVEQNLFAFKLNIQRARELFSREYPAVVVGDAAVTPHPDTGSGYSSGFRGFQEVKVLLKALANTSNDAAAFLDFGTRYELAVAEKALSGTQNICQNNIGMLKSYKEHMEELARQAQGSSTKNAFAHDIKLAGMLIQILESHDRTAKIYEAIVKDKTGNIPTPPMWDKGPKQLWQRMGRTWDLIQKLTDQKHLLEPQLAALEAAIEKFK